MSLQIYGSTLWYIYSVGRTPASSIHCNTYIGQTKANYHPSFSPVSHIYNQILITPILKCFCYICWRQNVEFATILIFTTGHNGSRFVWSSCPKEKWQIFNTQSSYHNFSNCRLNLENIVLLSFKGIFFKNPSTIIQM